MVKEEKQCRRKVSEGSGQKWTAGRFTPKVSSSQSGQPGLCFQHRSTGLMENPTEQPLTSDKEDWE